MYLCLLQNGEDVIRDALVIMSKTGDIYVGVLGTEPSLFSAPRPEARQVNYEETDIEMASLNTIIKTAQTADEGKHTCPRVIIKGGGNFWSSEGADFKIQASRLSFKPSVISGRRSTTLSLRSKDYIWCHRIRSSLSR